MTSNITALLSFADICFCVDPCDRWSISSSSANMYSRNTPVQYSSPEFPVGFSGSSYFDVRSLVNNLSSRETHWITPSGPTALDALLRLPLPGLDHVFNPVSIHSRFCSTIIYTDKATPFLLQDRRLDDLPGSH